ncbi:MAG: Abi family protein [Bacilli bacterium]|nr:Abi family protein [Bacilli bacterium]
MAQLTAFTNKRFLSIEDQISLLKSQGLCFKSTKEAKLILKTHSYYSIVNCYCDLLVSGKSPRVFKKGATFDELMAIRDFDTCFRRFLLPQLLYIEEKLNAAVINAYGSAKDQNGKPIHCQDDYLCMDSYETTNVVKRKAATKLIIQLEKAIENSKARDPIEYALKKYNYVPLWMLATQMSFGQTSRFYECNLPQIRNEVADIYHMTESQLRTVLKTIGTIRNCCAHSNIIYATKIPVNLPATIGVGKKKVNVDPAAIRRFGSILYCLKFLLSGNKFAKIIDELSDELSLLKKKLKTVPFQKVLKTMGISRRMIGDFNIKIS